MKTHDAAWHPSWWKEAYGQAWALVRESVRRDWQQTKHDLGLGGEELHQGFGDTLKQAFGGAPLPIATSAINVNSPISLGEWNDCQELYSYGFAARREFGAHHPQWNPMLEALLKSEWTEAHDQATRDWREIVQFVRRGYDLPVPSGPVSVQLSRPAEPPA